MIEILKRGIVPIVKYMGTCANCGTVARCDHSDLNPSVLVGKQLKCPICTCMIQVAMTTSYPQGFPFPAGPVMVGPAKELTQLGEFRP